MTYVCADEGVFKFFKLEEEEKKREKERRFKTYQSIDWREVLVVQVVHSSIQAIPFRFSR